MHRADFLLKPYVKDLGLGDGLRLSEMRRNWKVLFQGALAFHMFPSQLSRGELLVNVDSPVWLQELNFRRDALIRKLDSYGVRTIRFRLGRVSAKEQSEPPVRKQKSKCLTGTELAFIEETVDRITDEELRETFKTTMGKAIVSGKTKIS